MAAEGILLQPPNDYSGRVLPTGKMALIHGHGAACWRRTWQQRHSRNIICCSGAECTAAQAYALDCGGLPQLGDLKDGNQSTPARELTTSRAVAPYQEEKQES
ncbi:unnamed protein product [Urochloa humidicola]